MSFIPSSGDLFYIACKPRKRVIGGGIFDTAGTERVVEIQDNSYSGHIFRCIACDDYALVGEQKHGGYGSKEPYTFVLSQYTFSPVGPEVVRALGLINAEGE